MADGGELAAGVSCAAVRSLWELHDYNTAWEAKSFCISVLAVLTMDD